VVAVRHMGVVRRGLMVAGLMVFGRLVVMLGRLGVVLGRLAVMVRDMLGVAHGGSSLDDGQGARHADHPASELHRRDGRVTGP